MTVVAVGARRNDGIRFVFKFKTLLGYEKNRNEKIRNMENPFKFGTIVEAEYFTDRVAEVAYISQFVMSANHLVLISPRRFGKSSVVAKAVKLTGRTVVTLNLQRVISVSDMAAKLLRELFKVHPLARIKHLLTHFRIIWPFGSINPLKQNQHLILQKRHG